MPFVVAAIDSHSTDFLVNGEPPRRAALWLAPLVLGAAVRATQLRRELIGAEIEHGGSFHVSCTPEATRAQTEMCYPQLPEFLAEKRRVDPCERIVNPWYLHYRRLFAASC